MASRDPERSNSWVVTPMGVEPDISKTAGDRDSVPKY